VLGHQRNLAEALCAMVDLCDGQFSGEGSDAQKEIATIGPLIAYGRLMQTRDSLIDSLSRQLTLGRSLDRSDPAAEQHAFSTLTARLFRPDGLLGGPPMAEALTRRYVLFQEKGGRSGMQEAVDRMASTRTSAFDRVVYLVELAQSRLGGTLSEQLTNRLRQLTQAEEMAASCPADCGPEERLLRITRIYDYIAKAAAFPEGERHLLCRNLDEALINQLTTERIIERLDDGTGLLRDRTGRLLEFCTNRILPPTTRAHQVAQGRVVSLLKQPNFESRYVEGVTDPVRRQEMLRDLHELLARGGFV
jgi:hypothetical protein